MIISNLYKCLKSRTALLAVFCTCLLTVGACDGEGKEGEPDGSADTDTDTDTYTGTGTDTDTSTETETETESETEELECPENPEWASCENVTSFECGFSASCQEGTVTASWHVHVIEGEEEIICDYECTVECAEGCASEGELQSWPEDGTALLEEACLPRPVPFRDQRVHAASR